MNDIDDRLSLYMNDIDDRLSLYMNDIDDRLSLLEKPTGSLSNIFAVAKPSMVFSVIDGFATPHLN